MKILSGASKEHERGSSFCFTEVREASNGGKEGAGWVRARYWTRSESSGPLMRVPDHW